MKKVMALALAIMMCFSLFAGCTSTTDNSGTTDSSGATTNSAATASGMTGAISVVSREDGSGTRGAFITLFGVEQKDASGNKVDMTTVDAEITNSTSVMLTTVAGNENAIGYVSLGSLNDTVKALKIDGAEATVENVKDGSYAISRPFNIVYFDTKLSDVAKDFISFILSDDGQAVVSGDGYIAVESTGAYKGTAPSGKIVIAGSSSVYPVMEKLVEAYEAVNANADIELQQSDSSTGVSSAIEGVCDIGMSSRDLKDDELNAGLTTTVLATDGIAVIVNSANSLSSLTKEQVMKIFTGETTDWSDIG